MEGRIGQESGRVHNRIFLEFPEPLDFAPSQSTRRPPTIAPPPMNHWAFVCVSAVLLGACSGTPKRQTESFPSYPPKPGALTIQELLELPSVVNPQLSPDGKSVAFLVTEPTLEPGKSSSVT